MQLSRELPDYIYSLRQADGHQAKVNDRVLGRSFILSPNTLIEDWPVTSVAELSAEHLAPALEQNPALVILGTGERQIFPHRHRGDEQCLRRAHLQRAGRREPPRGDGHHSGKRAVKRQHCRQHVL